MLSSCGGGAWAAGVPWQHCCNHSTTRHSGLQSWGSLWGVGGLFCRPPRYRIKPSFFTQQALPACCRPPRPPWTLAQPKVRAEALGCPVLLRSQWRHWDICNWANIKYCMFICVSLHVGRKLCFHSPPPPMSLSVWEFSCRLWDLVPQTRWCGLATARSKARVG